MDYGRVHWYEPAELTPEQQLVYAANEPAPLADAEGRLYGPRNAMLISPTLGLAFHDYGAIVRRNTDLSQREHEIVTLELAASRKSEYEWHAHRTSSLGSGSLREDEVEALRLNLPSASFSSREELLRSLTRCLLDTHDLPDELFARASEMLGLRTMADLIYLVGFFDLLALHLQVFRVPLPPGAESAFS